MFRGGTFGRQLDNEGTIFINKLITDEVTTNLRDKD